MRNKCFYVAAVLLLLVVTIETRSVDESDNSTSIESNVEKKPSHHGSHRRPHRLRRAYPTDNRGINFGDFGDLISSFPWENVAPLMQQFFQSSYKEILNSDVVERFSNIMDKRGSMPITDILNDAMNSLPPHIQKILANFPMGFDDLSSMMDRKNITIPPAIKAFLCSEKP